MGVTVRGDSAHWRRILRPGGSADVRSGVQGAQQIPVAYPRHAGMEARSVAPP